MTITEFRRLIDTFGADRMRWPERQRGPAEALLAQSADAREAFARAARLDAALQSQSIEVPAFRRAQVVDAALARVATATSGRPARNWFRIARAFIPPAPAALALLALIGCLLGLRVPLPTLQSSEPLVAELSVLLTGDADEPL